MGRMLKNILYNILMMAGIVIVLTGGAAAAYRASKPVDLRVSADGYYEIYTAYDYERFWQKVTHNMPFICGRLMKDIYLNDVEEYDNWEHEALTRKGREVMLFSGEFDGNGYTVYGLYSENGYGLVEKNEGIIRDVSIKNSLITGDKDLGGVCLYNSGIISNCEFGGELKSLAPEPDVYSKMAGISLENKGVIERCGYRGSMTALRQSKHRRKAAVSVVNGGEIVNCYNFTWENIDKENDFYYSISNRGERCCFVRGDVRWKTYYNGQIIPLDGIWELYLSAFLDKDLNTIYLGAKSPLTCFKQAEQNSNRSTEGGICRKMLQEIGIDEKQDALRRALLDPNVCELIWSILVYKGINWESVVLEGVSRTEKGLVAYDIDEKTDDGRKAPAFAVEIYDKYHKEQHVRLSGYQMEIDGKKDCSAIWDLCTDILMEKSKESLRQNTWRIFEGGIIKEGDGFFILYLTEKGEGGFFYTAGEMLYQIEMQETAEEINEREYVPQKKDNSKKDVISKDIRINDILKSDIKSEKRKDGMEKVRDILTVEIWINSLALYRDENGLVTDKTQFCNKIWGVIVEKVWEGKTVGYVY